MRFRRSQIYYKNFWVSGIYRFLHVFLNGDHRLLFLEDQGMFSVNINKIVHILKYRMRSVFNLLNSSRSIFSVLRRSRYDSCPIPFSFLVKDLWTPSILSINHAKCGDHTEQQYSNKDRTVNALVTYIYIYIYIIIYIYIYTYIYIYYTLIFPRIGRNEVQSQKLDNSVYFSLVAFIIWSACNLECYQCLRVICIMQRHQL